jgi:hypothetical protein
MTDTTKSEHTPVTFVPPFTMEMLARSVFVTDPRVLAFIKSHGDGITATTMFERNESGWRTEAEARALKLAEALDYYADIARCIARSMGK